MKNKCNYSDRLVKIKLFKDNDKYQHDVFACINGKSYLLQRGIEIEVPYALARLLENSQSDDMQTENNIKSLAYKA